MTDQSGSPRCFGDKTCGRLQYLLYIEALLIIAKWVHVKQTSLPKVSVSALIQTGLVGKYLQLLSSLQVEL